MVLLAFCGCCGALKESNCLLVSFFCCMLIVITAEIAAGVWTYQNSDKLEDFVKTNFKHTLSKEYSVVQPRTEIVDHIQNSLQCCGVDGPSDWSNSRYNVKGGIIDLAISTAKIAYAVPPSCEFLKIILREYFNFSTQKIRSLDKKNLKLKFSKKDPFNAL